MALSKTRETGRAAVRAAARFRTPWAFEFLTGESADVAQGGMFIQAVNPPAVGTLLKVECDLETDGSSPFAAVARVAWIRNNPGEAEGMGLKFVRMEAGSQRQLDALLTRLAPRLEVTGHTRRNPLTSGEAEPSVPTPLSTAPRPHHMQAVRAAGASQTPRTSSTRPPAARSTRSTGAGLFTTASSPQRISQTPPASLASATSSRPAASAYPALASARPGSVTGRSSRPAATAQAEPHAAAAPSRTPDSLFPEPAAFGAFSAANYGAPEPTPNGATPQEGPQQGADSVAPMAAPHFDSGLEPAQATWYPAPPTAEGTSTAPPSSADFMEAWSPVADHVDARQSSPGQPTLHDTRPPSSPDGDPLNLVPRRTSWSPETLAALNPADLLDEPQGNGHVAATPPWDGHQTRDDDPDPGATSNTPLDAGPQATAPEAALDGPHQHVLDEALPSFLEAGGRPSLANTPQSDFGPDPAGSASPIDETVVVADLMAEGDTAHTAATTPPPVPGASTAPEDDFIGAPPSEAPSLPGQIQDLVPPEETTATTIGDAEEMLARAQRSVEMSDEGLPPEEATVVSAEFSTDGLPFTAADGDAVHLALPASTQHPSQPDLGANGALDMDSDHSMGPDDKGNFDPMYAEYAEYGQGSEHADDVGGAYSQTPQPNGPGNPSYDIPTVPPRPMQGNRTTQRPLRHRVVGTGKRKKSRRGLWAAVALLVLAAAGGGWWFVLGGSELVLASEAPLGTQVQAMAPEHAANQPAATAEASTGADSEAANGLGQAPYVIEVRTSPTGARVLIGAQRLTSPAKVRFSTLNEPLEIQAELPGHKPTSQTVQAEMFELDGNQHRLKVDLTLKPIRFN